MKLKQREALRRLSSAIKEATFAGLFDELQGFCQSPDSINDVCDAITEMEEFEKSEDECKKCTDRNCLVCATLLNN